MVTVAGGVEPDHNVEITWVILSSLGHNAQYVVLKNKIMQEPFKKRLKIKKTTPVL